MPGMDGIDAGATHPQDPRWSALRLILHSTRDDHDERFASTPHLFAAMLTKPLRRSQLFACLTRVMTLQPRSRAGWAAGGSTPAAPCRGCAQPDRRSCWSRIIR